MNCYGYGLKEVHMMETPRDISYSGDIYYSGKQIGSAYNGGYGGMTEVTLDPAFSAHEEVLNESFVERLFTLNDYERVFMDMVADKTEKGLVVVNYTNPFDIKFLTCSRDAAMEKIVKSVMFSDDARQVDSIEVFRSLQDFNIDESHQPDYFRATAVPIIEAPSVLDKIAAAREDSTDVSAAPKSKKPQKSREAEL